MNDTPYPNLEQSRFQFQQKSIEDIFTITSPQNYQIYDEIFQKSLNISYIGRMSGQKQINFHKFENLNQLTPTKVKKRINFSQFKGRVAESQIIQQQEQVSEEQLKFMNIRSFYGTNGKEMKPVEQCFFLCKNVSNEQLVRCKCELKNQSTFQVYLAGKDKTWSQLFFSVNLDTINVSLDYEDRNQNKQLMINVGSYHLLLENQKKKIVQYWYDQLNRMLKQCKCNEINFNILTKVQTFYNTRYETEDFFTHNCKTGDILLFQDNHFFAKAQRFITRSDYDHVGMVIRDNNYGTLIFESNSGSGVCLTPWKYVIRYGWFKTIPRITWRRLEIKRDKKFNDLVQKFVKDNISKTYHISFGKLLSNTSYIASQPNPGQQKQQGFFCSELIATLYKDLGLITRDEKNQNYKPACNFYPVDFSQKGYKLQNGQLSAEYQIYFDEQLLELDYKYINFKNS